MSEALSFAEIKLALLQGFLGTLAVRDVLDRTKHFIRSARGVSFYCAQTVDSADFAVGTNDTMFSDRARFTMKRLLSCPKNKLAIFGMDHFANQRHVYGTFLRIEPIDAVEFVRPSHSILEEVPVIVANAGDALRFFNPGFAF